MSAHSEIAPCDYSTAEPLLRVAAAYTIRPQTHMRLGSSAESTTHAVVSDLVEACTAQHAMPMASGARDCLLLINAVCATAAAVTTIWEGITMARDKPIVAASM